MSKEFVGGVVVNVYTQEFRMRDYSEFSQIAVVLLDDGSYEPQYVGYGKSAPAVNASIEQVQAYKDMIAAAMEAQAAELAMERAKKLADEAAAAAKAPAIGKTVKVVRGRKVAIGTVGKVFWMQDGPWGVKVGIGLGDKKDARGRFTDVAWTYAKNIEAVAA